MRTSVFAGPAVLRSAIKWQRTSVVVALFALTVSAAHSTTTQTYSVTNLGVPMYAAAINASRTIVGTYDFRGAVWDGGTYAPVYPDFPGAYYSNLSGINDSRTFVGTANIDGQYSQAMINRTLIWDKYTFAADINNSGQIVGTLSYFAYQKAIIGTQFGFTELGTLGGTTSSASDISDTGFITGRSRNANGQTHAFRSTGPGVMIDLGTLGGQSSVGNGVNNFGAVVGTSTLSTSGEHAFVTLGSQMIDLGTLGGRDSYGLDINNYGQIVGSSEYLSNSDNTKAFVATINGMFDLNSLLDDSGAGWLLVGATAINDLGYIVGNGFFNGVASSFLLTPSTVNTPVPEPDQYIMLVCGIGLIVGSAKRRLVQPQDKAAEHSGLRCQV